MTRKQRIGRAFGHARATYGRRATVQRLAAERLADMIAALPLPSAPRILEIGCGVGFLTQALKRRLPDAQILATDLAPAMVDACRENVAGPDFAVMDGEMPALAEGAFDLVCAGLAVQWFETLEPSLDRLCRLLKLGGRLAVSTLLDGSFQEWRAAHDAVGLTSGTPPFAAARRLQQFRFEGARARLVEQEVVERHADGAAFIQSLREIGAHVSEQRPLCAADLKRVLQRFEDDGAAVTYRLGYLTLRRPGGARGVFVTGTDTDVGKTVVSACLARAMAADYWKPIQTGAAIDAGDTEAVLRLSGARIHPPAYVYREPLSPHAAAAIEGGHIELGRLAPPKTDRPLVVEGAGGVLVPLNENALMIDLIARLDLPVVVVARSTLGTLNHTLLTLEALRAAGLEVAGVVMNGPPSASNREAIERYGQVRVIAEITPTDALTPDWVAEQAGRFDIPGALRRVDASDRGARRPQDVA